MVEKWCFFLKYADETSNEDLEKIIGQDIIIKKAYDVLEQFNWTEPELIAYEQELKRIWDNQAAEDYKQERLQEIREQEQKLEDLQKKIDHTKAALIAEGKAEGKAELIQMMLNNGNSVNDIAKVTGLSIDEIQKLI